MLEFIFSGITDGLAGLLDWAFLQFANTFGFDISQILTYAPVIGDLYTILQYVALALIAVIAIFQFGKFFTGPLSEAKDSPLQILVRIIISVVLVYWGNYFLQMVFDLCSYPMEMFSNMDASVNDSVFNGIAGTTTKAIEGGLGGLLLTLILLVILGWNVLKLLLEAIERWLVLCLLTYTSPLAYATVTSRSTGQIFRSWMSMVVGQCILLWANVWCIKLLISLLANAGDTAGSTVWVCAMAIALARVAQNIDSYLQQLGVNAATTGGSLLDSIMAVGTTLGGIGRAASKSGSGGVLGAWGSGMADAVKQGNIGKGAMYGGVYGAAAAGAGKFVRSKLGGQSAGDFVRSKFKDASDTVRGAATAGAAAASAGGMAAGMNAAANAMNDPNGQAGMPNGQSYKDVHPDTVRARAQESGRQAMNDAIANGASTEQAQKAAMQAYDDSIGNVSKILGMTATTMNDRSAFAETMKAETAESRESYAKQAGMLAAEKAIRAGRSPEEATAAAMQAYNQAYARDNVSAAQNPLSKEFEKTLPDTISTYQNGASRMHMDQSGKVRNGFGDAVSAETLDAASAESLGRMISGSASKEAVDRGYGLADTIPNPDPEAYDADGNLKPGYDADITPEGTVAARDLIDKHGADVADAVINGDEVIDGTSIGAAAIRNSSAAETLSESEEFSELGKALKSLSNEGRVATVIGENGDAINAEIEDFTVGDGGINLRYTPPGTVGADMETITSPVQNISICTAEKFDKMPKSEQAQYRYVGGKGSPGVYVRQAMGDVEEFRPRESFGGSKGRGNNPRRPYGGRNNKK